MTPTAPPVGAGTERPQTCTACPLLCEDIVVGPRSVRHACEAGTTAFAAAVTAARAAHEAWLGATPVPRDRGLDAAAAAIVGGRRVLVTGLADVTLEAVVAACDLAEAVAAAVDPGGPEAARVAGPTIARIGEVTAEWEELRDRADLVILWFCDPSTTHPRFVERFVQPLPDAQRARRTIAVGPDAVLPRSAGHSHVQVPAEAAVDAARILQARLAGKPAGDVSATLRDACETIAAAIEAAGCVAFVTRHEDEPIGLGPWSTAAVVRMVAHGRPAFQVPLVGGIRGGANEKGVAAVCGWRYAASGAIARADRAGTDFRPAECDAVRMIERGEVECVVVVGRAVPAVDAALAKHGDPVTVVRIAEAIEPQSAAASSIQIRTASLLTHPHGSMLRGDGRLVRLGTSSPAPLPSVEAVVRAVEERVRLRLSAARGGER